MVGLLAKIFIKNGENTDNPQTRTAYGVLCGVVGIVLNILLFAFKLVAGALSGSVAITADAINNLSDAGSSLITLIGFRLSAKKPDHEHPFGHGRMEYISGLLVSFLIMTMGIELAQSSFDKILNPTDVHFDTLVAVILAVSVLGKLYMAFYNSRIGIKINSSAMRATATDSISDCITTAIVLVSMLINHFTNLKIDGQCGLLVSVFIVIAGLRAAKETMAPLLGQAPEKEFVEKIEKAALEYEEIIGIHDLVVHDYGPGRRMVTFHAEVPCDGDINIMHDAVDNLERELKVKFDCEAVIHMDPLNVTDNEVCKMRDTVSGIVRQINSAITIHDFRMVSGPTHTNLIFDAVIPHSLDADTVKRQICDQIEQLDKKYFAVVKIDTDYS